MNFSANRQRLNYLLYNRERKLPKKYFLPKFIEQNRKQ